MKVYQRIVARLGVAFASVILAVVVPVSVPIMASAATGWTSPVALSLTDTAGSGAGIDFATAPNGNVFAAWAAWDGSGYVAQVASSSNSGVTWSSPVTLSEPGGHAEAVKVATNASGDALVVWELDDGLWMVQTSVSTDGGLTWSAYSTISDDSIPTGGSQVAGLGEDGFVVTMQAYNGGFYDLFARTTPDSGESWSAFHQLSDGLVNSVFGDVAVDPSGNIGVTWLANIGGEYEIQAISSQDGGATWGAISGLAPGDTATYDPLIAANKAGGFTVVWHSTEAGSNNILYSTSVNAGLTWSSALPIALDVGDSPQLTFATGSNHDSVVMWTVSDGFTTTLYAARSGDGGQTWSDPLVATDQPSNPGYPIYSPQVAITPLGEILVVWSYAVDITMLNDVVWFTSSLDNAVSWSAPLALSSPGGTLPHVVSTPQGDVIVGLTLITAHSPGRSHVETTSRLAGLPNTGMSATQTLGAGLAAGATLLTGVIVAVLARRRFAQS